MSQGKLPDRPSLAYLKKLAKDRLAELRRTDARARLALAQLAVAREHGFASWRALKAELDRRRAPSLAAFFAACRDGDAAALRRLLAAEAGLVRERNADGGTGLHLAVRHAGVVRLLLEQGADPDARDTGDNAYPLHFAAGGGHLDSMRALLDAGGDVHGVGDVHRLEVIGWATCFHDRIREDVVSLLLGRGARHKIFSAVAVGIGVGDLTPIRRLVAEDLEALLRRMSRFEQGKTPLHFAIAPPDGISGFPINTVRRHAVVNLLIELGAPLDVEDDKGRTPLEVALLVGDQESARRLREAGAREPKLAPASVPAARLGESVQKLMPMMAVADLRATIRWYTSIGFRVVAEHEHEGVLDWAMLSLGGAELMLCAHGPATRREGVSFWYTTDRLDEIYQALKRRQLGTSLAALGGGTPVDLPVEFVQDLHETHYGSREFTIRDSNGFDLAFIQSSKEP